MKKTLLLSFCAYIFIGGMYDAAGQTTVPAGNVYGTWTLAGSPYNVIGSVTVPQDSTLIIEPGVKVEFQGHYKFSVLGNIQAAGTATDSITFTVRPDSIASGWWGFCFNGTTSSQDSSRFVYCKVQYGNAKGGTGVDLSGGAFRVNDFSKIRIAGCSIMNNSASIDGGAIYCNFSSPVITNSIISNNVALGSGGAIFCSYSSPAITNNTISNNSVSNTGGAIWCYTSFPAITNNLICNNSATNSGGAIFSHSSSPKITNCTIANNKTDGTSSGGGALYVIYASDPIFKNTILYGNVAVSGIGNTVFIGDDGSDPVFDYCNIEGGSAAFYLNGTIYTGAYTNNINSNPLFVSPAGGAGAGFNGLSADWTLQSASSCIDAGTPDTAGLFLPATDLANNPRIVVCTIDIGAYEYQGGLPFLISVAPTNILCNGTGTGTATVTATNGITPYTYQWSTGQTDSLITGLGTGTYTVTVTDFSGCMRTASATISEPSTLAGNASIVKNVSCADSSDGSATIGPIGGTTPYSYLWSDGQIAQTITGLSDGSYTVTVTDNNGCTIEAAVNITEPAPLAAAAIVNNIECGDTTSATATVTASGGTTPYSYLWNNGQNSQNASGLNNGPCSVTVTDNNGCTFTAADTATTQSYPSIPLCIVTVDTTSTKNLVVWEKPITGIIEGFNIYREVGANYSHIGYVPYDSLSRFIDTVFGINPNITSYKYKISVTDTCGLESPISEYHKTIHLTTNLGGGGEINLIWSGYEGFNYGYYRIYRDSSLLGNWQLLDSVPNNNFMWTDWSPSQYGRYLIEVVHPAGCAVTLKSSENYNSTRSNIKPATASPSYIFQKYNSELSINIFPNPNNGRFEVEMVNASLPEDAKYELSIYNVLGQKLMQHSIPEGIKNFIVDLNGYPKGIYQLKMEMEKSVKNVRIVIQ